MWAAHQRCLDKCDVHPLCAAGLVACLNCQGAFEIAKTRDAEKHLVHLQPSGASGRLVPQAVQQAGMGHFQVAAHHQVAAQLHTLQALLLTACCSSTWIRCSNSPSDTNSRSPSFVFLAPCTSVGANAHARLCTGTELTHCAQLAHHYSDGCVEQSPLASNLFQVLSGALKWIEAL